MNEIKIPQELVDGSRLISAPTARLELRTIGKAIFALCHQKDQTIAFAFLSSSLLHFLENSNSAEIFDVSLNLSKTLAGPPPDRALILRLRMSNGNLITLNQADELYVAEPYVACDNSSSVYSPSRIWGLTGPGYLEKMLLTERMIAFLEDMGQEHLQHLLHTLWKDFELHLQCSKSCHNRATISGEVMAFSVTPFANGLFIFDYV